ncbi:hypothetical protein [Streptomyces leeuwenhoekii]|uniref:hypothetical protein n=1 Tax=Streptomyces leeuwenhoekii TaxID=1437453 RepID=UPI000AFA3A19|nr:hypothetical protein [Streptomyces leeuwenhoekii]
MSFTLVSRGRVAHLLRDGDTYRVACVRCGVLLETTDRCQAENKYVYLNAPGVKCHPA